MRRKLLQHGVVVLVFFVNIGDEQQQIGILEGGMGEAVHGLLHLVGWVFDDARRIREDHLEIIAAHDADDAVAGRLRLGRDDGHPLAHEGVHQRALADVWAAYDVDEAGTVDLFRQSKAMFNYLQ